MSLSSTVDGYVNVCNLLDELSQSTETPVNWRRTLYPAIEQLRAASAPAEQIDVADLLSVTLLKLDWAILKGDGEKQARARQKLGELGKTRQVNPTLAPPLETTSLETAPLRQITSPLKTTPPLKTNTNLH